MIINYTQIICAKKSSSVLSDAVSMVTTSKAHSLEWLFDVFFYKVIGLAIKGLENSIGLHNHLAGDE